MVWRLFAVWMESHHRNMLLFMESSRAKFCYDLYCFPSAAVASVQCFSQHIPVIVQDSSLFKIIERNFLSLLHCIKQRPRSEPGGRCRGWASLSSCGRFVVYYAQFERVECVRHLFVLCKIMLMPFVRIVQIADQPVKCIRSSCFEQGLWSAGPWPWAGTTKSMRGKTRDEFEIQGLRYTTHKTYKCTTTWPSTSILCIRLLLSWTALSKMISRSAHGMFAHGIWLPGSPQRRRKVEKLQRLWAKSNGASMWEMVSEINYFGEFWKLLLSFWIWEPREKLPVIYKGTECVKKPPAATTHLLWRRSSMSFALSGVSYVAPLPFFTGANSSSRKTWKYSEICW